jgi:predicted N-acetyltransferase YhbS
MPITIRPATPADANECGRILYAAFATLADHHNFPRDFSSVEAATEIVSLLTGHPGFLGLVAEQDGRIVGSNFADMRSAIAGIGPISVDPDVQNQGIGRILMRALMDHATTSHVAGIRLVQAAYHNRSLCLYTRLGFQMREPMSIMQGPPLNAGFAGYNVRLATVADSATCNLLCRRAWARPQPGAQRCNWPEHSKRGRASRPDHRLCDGDRFSLPRRDRDQPRPEGPDRCGEFLLRTRLPAADA